MNIENTPKTNILRVKIRSSFPHIALKDFLNKLTGGGKK